MRNQIKSIFCCNILPVILFIAFGFIAYFTFNYAVSNKTYIDGTELKWYEPYIVAFGIGLIGFCVGKIIYILVYKPYINNKFDSMDNFPFGAF